MTPLSIGFIGIGVLFILLFSGMPIGLVMAFVGFTGYAYVTGFGPALGVLRTVPFSTFADYGLSVIPLFVLMGTFAFYAGLSQDLYSTARSWLGRLRGGLAMSTVGACAAFAAVSGSSLATAATMGKVALPEMKRYKYDSRLATGTIAAGGTIGILIPPSVILIIYGVLTEQSIGKLFAAGFIPGILEAVFYMVTIFILTTRDPLMGPPGPVTSFREKVTSLKGSWGVLAIFVLVIGGIYLGVFSPTEAAGVGAFGTFAFGLARRKLGWQAFKESLTDAGKTAAMIFVIILGANIFGYFLAVTGVPSAIATSMAGLPVSRYFILAGILIIYVLLGCVMDSMAMILITVPIFFPLIMQLGFNPIWFGILIVRVCEIGLITPPVGLNVYIIKGIAKDIPMGTIFRGIIPFLIADLCHVAMLVAIPQVTLFLPSLMK